MIKNKICNVYTKKNLHILSMDNSFLNLRYNFPWKWTSASSFYLMFSVFLCLDSGEHESDWYHFIIFVLFSFTIVKLSYLFPLALLRFKRTWKLLMWFHCWPLLWWKRLRLLFKQSQNALIHTDELKSFTCPTTYMCI